MRDSENMAVEDLREELERRYLEKRKSSYGSHGDLVVETGSYFIREPNDDPREILTYIMGNSCKATALGEMK